MDRLLSPKTIKNIRATLRRILVSAMDWGFIDRVPNLPKVKVPDRGWDFFTREESERLIAAARDDEERALFMFALRTGARAGEQLAVRWGDIDWQSGVIVFRRSSTLGNVGPTKSGAARADVRGAGACASEDQTPTERLGVLPNGRQAAHALATARADGGRLSTSGLAGNPLARSATQLRLSTGVFVSPDQISAGLAWPQHHQHDHALLALGTRKWRGLDPIFGKSSRRGKHVAKAVGENNSLFISAS